MRRELFTSLLHSGHFTDRYSTDVQNMCIIYNDAVVFCASVQVTHLCVSVCACVSIIVCTLMWLIISAAKVYWGVLLPFLMMPEPIDKATVAQVRNRWVPVLEKQQVVHQSSLMKLWISRQITKMTWGCLEPITAGSLGIDDAIPGRRSEVPHPRQQPGPYRPLLKTCTCPQRQWD